MSAFARIHPASGAKCGNSGAVCEVLPSRGAISSVVFSSGSTTVFEPPWWINGRSTFCDTVVLGAFLVGILGAMSRRRGPLRCSRVTKHQPLAATAMLLEQGTESLRTISLPEKVAEVGIKAWNERPQLAILRHLMECAVKGKATLEDVLDDIKGLLGLDQSLLAYMYMRSLANENVDLYYGLLLRDPALLLPVVYTPTAGEVCQKFGHMPFYLRGCYLSLSYRGRVKEVLEDYAKEMLTKDATGQYECDCIVFSDGGRILGLGDLGIWGMGIPLGKLDLYTVCGGFNPRRTIPVIIDAGIDLAEGNSAKLDIRGSPFYAGLRRDRIKHINEAGALVNSAYYGDSSFIHEFMTAARDLFGRACLLQFEDFNSNDAFPLLAEYRDKFLTYNDDIQGTAAVCVAAIFGACRNIYREGDLIEEVVGRKYLFHGAGSANLGCAQLLIKEAGVPATSVFVTNSKGLLWKTEDGSDGNFRNHDQQAVAQEGKPTFDSSTLIDCIRHLKPDALIGAVGVAPGCFGEEIVRAMVRVTDEKNAARAPGRPPSRPIIFALSNPKTQAEITAEDCYKFSGGKAIFGSGTKFDDVVVKGKTREPGQVNNFFIFPGMSFGAISCEATKIPERLFLVAAMAVSSCLEACELEADSVVPCLGRIRQVALRVATEVVLECQKLGLAVKKLGETKEEVEGALKARMWMPSVERRSV